jgi:choline-sulfatase
MADDTVVVFTADHGDQLGERGLWYKMCFFEHAARIPLVISAPGGARGVAVDDHVSLLDLLPTLVDLAGGDATSDLGHVVDGASLVPQLHGDRDTDRTVLGEYLGEGAIAPILMIRRGPWKYVWSAPDGPQLFDLASDPDERRNIAHDPEHADVAAAFRAEIDLRWDHERIRSEVLASQRARRVVDRALRSGRHVAWDHVPVPDSANQYMRNHLDLNALELARRLPRPQVAPSGPAVPAPAATNGQVAGPSWSRTLP